MFYTLIFLVPLFFTTISVSEQSFLTGQLVIAQKEILYFSFGILLVFILFSILIYRNARRQKNKEIYQLRVQSEALRMEKKKAEAECQEKVAFLSTITHELRTPLYAVTGLTQLIQEDNRDPNLNEHLSSLKFSGEYLLSLINNILDYNKLEAKKVMVESTDFDLKKRIKNVLIALKKSALDRNNSLQFEFGKDIPQNLMGDPLKISQILINLIGNAIKFTKNGNIWVRVHMIHKGKKEVVLNFQVADNGLGISKEKQQDIFKDYTQESAKTNRKFGGTGLGLAIVKKLLALMDSKIKLQSELGSGSTFQFAIPFKISNILPSETEKPHINPIAYDTLAGKKVLIVEDNTINQMITKRMLEKYHANCTLADGGELAIQKLKHTAFDLILMDINMPGINGIETTKRIRTFDTEIPIIALTGITLQAELNKYPSYGFTGVLPKPYKTELFFDKITNSLAGIPK